MHRSVNSIDHALLNDLFRVWSSGPSDGPVPLKVLVNAGNLIMTFVVVKELALRAKRLTGFRLGGVPRLIEHGPEVAVPYALKVQTFVESLSYFLCADSLNLR